MRVIDVPKDGDLPVDLVLSGGTLRFPEVGSAFVPGGLFRECDIIAKSLRDVDWGLSVMERCKFSGEYRDNDFGTKHLELADGRVVSGLLKACDFSGARLHGCRFFDTELESCRFPGWPGFIVLAPRSNGHVLARKTWHGRLAAWVVVHQSQAEEASAVAWDAVELSKENKVKLGVVRTALERFPDIVRIS